MSNTTVLYKHEKNFPPIFKFLVITIIIFITISLIFILFFQWLPVLIFQSALIGAFFLASSIIIIYVHTYGYWADINKFYLEYIPKEINYMKGSEYIGVVIANLNLRFDRYFHIYNTGIILLIERLRNQGVPIRIINNADEKRFKVLVDDRYCTELYIIGHGRRNALKIHKNKFIEYEDFKDAPRKRRVEQLHCCDKGGRSLAEILGAEEKFKSYNERNCEETINYLLNELISY
jgi:hypothetical protein